MTSSSSKISSSKFSSISHCPKSINQKYFGFAKTNPTLVLAHIWSCSNLKNDLMTPEAKKFIFVPCTMTEVIAKTHA